MFLPVPIYRPIRARIIEAPIADHRHREILYFDRGSDKRVLEMIDLSSITSFAVVYADTHVFREYRSGSVPLTVCLSARTRARGLLLGEMLYLFQTFRLQWSITNLEL